MRSAIAAPALACLFWSLTPDAAFAQDCTPQDRDCDGIPDHLEHTLLETFRPFFRFSRDNGDNETFRPADVGTYLRLSEIDGSSDEGDQVVVSRAKMAQTPAQLTSITVKDSSSNIL